MTLLIETEQKQTTPSQVSNATKKDLSRLFELANENLNSQDWNQIYETAFKGINPREQEIITNFKKRLIEGSPNDNLKKIQNLGDKTAEQLIVLTSIYFDQNSVD